MAKISKASRKYHRPEVVRCGRLYRFKKSILIGNVNKFIGNYSTLKAII